MMCLVALMKDAVVRQGDDVHGSTDERCCTNLQRDDFGSTDERYCTEDRR